MTTFVLLASLFLILGWAHWIFVLISFQPRKSTELNREEPLPPVSVIICCRNDYEVLLVHLMSIREQDYPTFEVIVVDDYSDPSYGKAMEDIASMGVKVVGNTGRQGKKHALQTGIAHTRYNWVLLTDADCAPASKYWIQSIMSKNAGSDVILGYGAYQKLPGLLNALIQYETVVSASQFLAMALIGKPYMAVGRNLAYRKTTFFKSNGFDRHLDIASGDDDLLMNDLPEASRISIEVDLPAHTISIPPASWQAYLRQKKRHVQTAKYYKSSAQVFLGVYHFSHMGFLLIMPVLLFTNPVFALIIYGLRWMVHWSIIGICAKRLNERPPKWFPVTEVLLCFVYFRLIPHTIRNSNEW